jgi:hypothetical protein
MGDGVGVALGIELLIFVLKATRVLALVTHSALVWFRILFGCHMPNMRDELRAASAMAI